jgi:hypothetical protein
LLALFAGIGIPFAILLWMLVDGALRTPAFQATLIGTAFLFALAALLRPAPRRRRR